MQPEPLLDFISKIEITADRINSIETDKTVRVDPALMRIAKLLLANLLQNINYENSNSTKSAIATYSGLLILVRTMENSLK